MKRAILLTLRNSDFTEMFRLARVMKDSGRFQPIILSYTSAGNDVEYQRRMCSEHDIEMRYEREALIGGRSSIPRFIKSDRDKFTQRYPWSKPFVQILDQTYGNLMRVIYYVHTVYKQLKQYHRLIGELKPNILILPEDIVGLALPTFIKVGHQHNIPSLIVPYTIANASEAAETLLAYKHQHVKGFHQITALLFPRWVYTYKGVKMLRLPYFFIWGLEVLRMSPPDPWMMNSGYANAIAVENEHMRKYYMNEGFYAHKLRDTGAIYDDTLSSILANKQERREELYKKLGLPAGKPLIVVASPSNQLVDQRPCKFTSYDEALDSVAIPLSKHLDKYNIIVRPHPNFMVVADHYAQYGIKHTDMDTAELIPLADIFIAAASATIRWAIACGIPVINYDLFKYRYADYNGEQGVVPVYEPEEFEAALNRMIVDTAYYDDIRAKQQAAMHEWGHTDGQSANRIIDLCEELTNLEVVDRTPTSRPRSPERKVG